MNVNKGRKRNNEQKRRDVFCTLHGTYGFEVSKSEEAFRFFFSHPNFFEGLPTKPQKGGGKCFYF